VKSNGYLSDVAKLSALLDHIQHKFIANTSILIASWKHSKYSRVNSVNILFFFQSTIFCSKPFNLSEHVSIFLFLHCLLMLSSFKCSKMSGVYASFATNDHLQGVHADDGCSGLTRTDLFCARPRRVLLELCPVKANARTYKIIVIDVLIPFLCMATKIL